MFIKFVVFVYGIDCLLFGIAFMLCPGQSLLAHDFQNI